MKKTKEFFVVLFSILICVFLVIFIVQATTTISTNIVTGGTVATGGADSSTGVNLDVRGTASISQDFYVKGNTYLVGASLSEDLFASGAVQFGSGPDVTTVSYSRFGTGTTGHALADADDLLVTGLLEVDATASFDTAVSISEEGIRLDDGVTIASGVASPSADCVIGSIYLRTGTASSSMGTMFNMCTADNTWTSLASASDPGLW